MPSLPAPIKRCFEEKIWEKSRSLHDKISFFCFGPQKNYEYFITVYFYAFSFSKCHHWTQFLFSFSDNFLSVEFVSWNVRIKFCPQPSRVTRDHVRWISFLFPVLPNSLGMLYLFSTPSRLFPGSSPTLQSTREFWKNTCAVFFSLIYVIIK